MALTTHEDGRRDPGVGERTQAHVFAVILTKGPLSRRDIARLTGLSQATITKAVKPLLASGYVVEEAESARGPGRPAIPLRANESSHYVLGIKVTAQELIGVVTSPQADVLASERRPLRGTEVDTVVQSVAAMASDLLDRRPEFRERAEGIGLGLGGHVDGRTGTLKYSPMLGWRNVPLAELIEQATGLYTVAENDVNTLAVAEQLFGAGQDIECFAVVTVGAGVGCGLVIDGELVHGALGMAGEIGHIVVEPGGEVCRCGNRGCLEAIASDGAILASIRRAGGPRLETVGDAALLAREGDERAREAFSRAGAMLGRGIAIVANLVNPSRVILSGEGIVASDLLLDRLRDALEQHTFSSADAVPEIVPRPLGDEAWARGAAANVLRHLIARPLTAGGRAGSSRRR